MRDHDDRLAERLVQRREQAEHVFGALAIEVAGRLVGDDDLRIGDDGARDGDALLLATRELARRVIGPIGKVHQLERDVDAPFALRFGEWRQEQRQLDVLRRRQHGHQVVELEDEPDVARPPRGAGALAHPADLLAGHSNRSGRGLIDSGDEV